MLTRPLLFIIPFLAGHFLWAGTYQKSDLLGEKSLCAEIKNEIETGRSCSPYFQSDLQDAQKSATSLDEYLAFEEIKRNVLMMANSQVRSSLILLKSIGMERPGLDLERKLLSLKLNGINPEIPDVPSSPELRKKYAVASLRYHELKSLLAVKKFLPDEMETVKEKIKWLELRFPLVSHHHFGAYASSFCKKQRINCRPERENNQNERLLDTYLFEDKAVGVSKTEFNSIAGKAMQRSSDSQELVKELELSFSNQLNSLLNLKSLEQCDLMNLHSRITFEVINSSANPEALFGKYCQCQMSSQVIDENLVLGLEMASLGGLGLCFTPTGVGQVLGCPTAVIAGMGATAANAVNFIDKAQNFQTIAEQKRIVEFLDRTDLNKEEENYLHEKEMSSIKEAGVSGLAGLIGFGIGNVGFKRLIKYFDRGKVSNSMKDLNKSEKEYLENSLQKLNPEKQTMAFVLLEKLDDESRLVLIKRPDILIQELSKKGNACDL